MKKPATSLSKTPTPPTASRVRSASPHAVETRLESDSAAAVSNYFGRVMLPITGETRDSKRSSTEDRIPGPESTERSSISALDSYMRDVGSFSLLKSDEEGPLARAAQNGDAGARDRMITSNLRLVIKIARDYRELGLPIEDLINEGNIGLMKAVDMFDPERGVRFSSYAAQWIKQYVRRALSNHARTIRLPLHMVDRVAKIHHYSTQFMRDHGREPTLEEISAALELPVKKISEAKLASQRARSLDRPLSDDSESSLADVVADESVVDASTAIDADSTLELLPRLLRKLSERESIILQRRFGLDGDAPETLDRIGDRLGVCRERVRQLQNEALLRLRELVESGAVSSA